MAPKAKVPTWRSAPQVESPTRAAERAAAAWKPPPPSVAARSVDNVRARPRRSASSYAAYTAADTAAFEAAFGAHLVPAKDIMSPVASPALSPQKVMGPQTLEPDMLSPHIQKVFFSTVASIAPSLQNFGRWIPMCLRLGLSSVC